MMLVLKKSSEKSIYAL